MGSILKAKCECGYTSPEIYAGGGIKNFQTQCGVPAVCAKCLDVVEVNIMESIIKCPNCQGNVIVYGENTMYIDSDKNRKDNMKLNIFN